MAKNLNDPQYEAKTAEILAKAAALYEADYGDDSDEYNMTGTFKGPVHVETLLHTAEEDAEHFNLTAEQVAEVQWLYNEVFNTFNHVIDAHRLVEFVRDAKHESRAQRHHWVVTAAGNFFRIYHERAELMAYARARVEELCPGMEAGIEDTLRKHYELKAAEEVNPAGLRLVH